MIRWDGEDAAVVNEPKRRMSADERWTPLSRLDIGSNERWRCSVALMRPAAAEDDESAEAHLTGIADAQMVDELDDSETSAPVEIAVGVLIRERRSRRR